MKIPLLDLKAQYYTYREEIKEAIEEVLESQHFILGPKVKEFEEEIARYCVVKEAVGVASGTDALLLSLMAIGIGHEDEVITTPYTFFATAEAIFRLGASPVFVDIDPQTYNIDPERIEEHLKKHPFPRLKAIIPVHLFGQCTDMNPILEIAQKYHLKVIEDACQALGAKYSKGEDLFQAGTMGELGCFSFFPSKNLGAFGDGGMVVTNDSELASKIRILRVHGANPKNYHPLVGINSRLDAIQAAILKVKLKYLDSWNKARQGKARRYQRLFEEAELLPFLTPPGERGEDFHTYNQYVVRVLERDRLGEFLAKNGIETAIYYPLPLHLQACFKVMGYKKGDFFEAERASKETLSLPIYPELEAPAQEYIVSKIREFYCEGYFKKSNKG